MDWEKFIQKYSRKQIIEAFPEISPRLPNAWLSGERQPPTYAQEALAAWLEAKFPSHSKRPKK